MSRLIYIVPWAICDTENLYIKKIEMRSEEVPKEHAAFEDWTIQTVMPSPDRRSKDIYIVLDVYCGYDFQRPHQEVSILDVTNSVSHLQELGYAPAEEGEKEFIRQRILRWDKPIKNAKASKKTLTKKKQSRLGKSR